MHKISFFIMLASAIAAGLFIAWVDSRPNWDDTGITAGMLLVVTALLGFIAPRRAWLWALAAGVWIPLAGILLHDDFSMLLVGVIAFVGAYAGAVTRWVVLPPQTGQHI